MCLEVTPTVPVPDESLRLSHSVKDRTGRCQWGGREGTSMALVSVLGFYILKRSCCLGLFPASPGGRTWGFCIPLTKPPLKSCWGSLWARGGQSELAGAVPPCGASPGAMGSPTASGASPAWAGMLPRAVPVVSPANLGRLHAAHGQCRGSLRKLLLRWRATFLFVTSACGEKMTVFWMHAVLKLSHVSGICEAVPPGTQKNAVRAAPGRGFSSGCRALILGLPSSPWRNPSALRAQTRRQVGKGSGLK